MCRGICGLFPHIDICVLYGAVCKVRSTTIALSGTNVVIKKALSREKVGILIKILAQSRWTFDLGDKMNIT